MFRVLVLPRCERRLTTLWKPSCCADGGVTSLCWLSSMASIASDPGSHRLSWMLIAIWFAMALFAWTGVIVGLGAVVLRTPCGRRAEAISWFLGVLVWLPILSAMDLELISDAAAASAGVGSVASPSSIWTSRSGMLNETTEPLSDGPGLIAGSSR